MHDKPLTFRFKFLIDYLPMLRVGSCIQPFNKLQQLIFCLGNIVPQNEGHLDLLRQVPVFSDLQPGPSFELVFVNGFEKSLTRLLVRIYK
jgi:hypothetical protein